MTRPCNVCSHPERIEIDRLLVNGMAAAAVARQFGLVGRTVLRHADKHLPETLQAAAQRDDEARELDVLAEVKALHRRTLRILDASDDSPRTGLSAIREARGNLELLGKLLGKIDERPQINVLLSPQWIELRTAILEALKGFPEARTAVAKALLEVNSRE